MPMYKTGTVPNTITIIGKDLDPGGTFNGDLAPAQGVLKAGTLMKYDAATKILAKGVVGTDTLFGVLAFGVDTGAVGATEVLPGMVWRKGTFLRQEIESANNVVITAGSADDLALRDKGIYLEFSYSGYVGLNPAPAGTIP